MTFGVWDFTKICLAGLYVVHISSRPVLLYLRKQKNFSPYCLHFLTDLGDFRYWEIPWLSWISAQWKPYLTLGCQWIFVLTVDIWGTRWRSWSRHCATSRKVAGSIPDDVIEIFNWHNPSGHTMALGLTQPLTEISTRNVFLGVKAASV